MGFYLNKKIYLNITSNMEASLRKIRIQTGVVQRISKDKVMYAKEVEDMRKEMREKNPEEYMIKKKTQMLQESEMMVPDCQKRLAQSIEQLRSLLEQNQSACEDEIYVKAKNLLAEIEA